MGATALRWTELRRGNQVMGLAIGRRTTLVRERQGSVNMVDPSGEMDTSPMDMTRPVNGDCMYPEWGTDIGLVGLCRRLNGLMHGKWAIHWRLSNGYFLSASWSDVETVVFVVVPEWIPWLYEYTGGCPLTSNRGGRRIWYLLVHLRGSPSA